MWSFKMIHAFSNQSTDIYYNTRRAVKKRITNAGHLEADFQGLSLRSTKLTLKEICFNSLQIICWFFSYHSFSQRN